jgi:hypothetical protein
MITKEQFVESILKEIKILKHLFTKIKPGTLDYRPTEKQRSILELLQYLGHGPAMLVAGIKNGGVGDFKAGMEAASADAAENFPKRMDELAALVQSVVTPMTDADFSTEIDLFGRGQAQTKAAWLFELILKNLVGYKMQLFLYIKATGNFDIGTADVWRGEDMKKG